MYLYIYVYIFRILPRYDHGGTVRLQKELQQSDWK